jgi:hypothetical protein
VETRGKVKQYRLARDGSRKDPWIVRDPQGQFSTLAEAKQALATYYQQEISRLLGHLTVLTTASLIDLLPEEAEEWHRRVTGKES